MATGRQCVLPTATSWADLLDRDPPFSTGAVGGVNAINYDTMGRTYRMGVRLKF